MSNIIIILVLLIPSICFAVPVPSSAIKNAGLLTIYGTTFGVNDVSAIEYTRDNIEAGVSGAAFVKTGWTVWEGSSTNIEVKYSNLQSHSGNNSLLSAFYGAEGVGYDSFFMYDTQATDKTDEIYITAWTYMDKQDASTVMQWKNWWFNSVTSISSTSVMQCAAFWRDDGVGDRWDASPFRRLSVDYANVLPFSPATNAYNPKPQWKRIEIFVKPSSSNGVADGGLSWYRVDEPSMAREDFGFITHGASDPVWRYIQLGMFYGSLTPTETIRDCKVYHDDIYISNTRARIEVSNSSTWVLALDREVLQATMWDTGEITADYSTTLTGTVYAYVVDENGDVNANGVIISSTQPTTSGTIKGATVKRAILK